MGEVSIKNFCELTLSKIFKYFNMFNAQAKML